MCSDPTSPTKGNILIVDDVPENLRLLSTMLTEQGYKVRPVINGKLALNAAQLLPPELILLDIMMPELNGYEVCQQLKASVATREIPVIFLSALDDVSDKVKAFSVGGVDYITKPFQAEEVLARVKNQLSLRSLQEQLSEQNALLQQEILVRQQAEEALKRTQAQLIQTEKMSSLVQVGVDRIQGIVRSLQIFSKQNEADKKAVDIHQCIDCTLLILQHRLKAVEQAGEIKVIKDYGQLPKIICYPSQLNQVFMKLFNN